MCSTENLKTKRKELKFRKLKEKKLKEKKPCVVLHIYTSTEGEIAAACIVEDETVKVKIPQPTITRVIVDLLSAYYV